MTAAPEPSSVKRALAGHAAIGLLASALLYLVCLTGTVCVFYPELQRLEQRDAPEMERISPTAVQRGVEAVLASERGKPLTTHLYVHMPVEDLPRTTITTDSQAVHLREDGSVAGPEEIAWSDFLVALHYTLNLPGLVGLTVVGALGAMILTLTITGVVAHPRIFRDAFALRARDRNGVGLADWHNRLSVWTLPFSTAIALTGAVIGLGSLTAWGLASLFEKSKVEDVYAPLFGEEGKPDARRSGAPDVAAVIAAFTRDHPEARPTYVTIHEPLTEGQEVQVSAKYARRLIFGETYRYDARGSFLGKAGLSDGKLGQQASASVYGLHFGDYGGLPVKLAYLLFGAALSAICATGVYIWLGKRRRRGHDEPRLLRLWDSVVWGSPFMLGATLALRLALGNATPLVPVFWVGLAALLLSAMTPVGASRFRRVMQGLAALGLVVPAVMTLT
ncbi:putative iron-regulated membrane protein [Novosphingobium chloroacetimidivorans]|uniref:Putative iron-regulated membrane protein n=1 Tax=Novosphingobium chloroacetimidivorans TaxID=1428314 RepID=A0A7W7NXM0_9SPHN|nr:PepSY-associated TM helix domain-containing protein [Novosphingobium chloroacetimidivorans]MBB4860496.1 putative iron-regulated membrane protein [Novosphingobium chloroacetimidivorans]